jgi:hypothetical protein
MSSSSIVSSDLSIPFLDPAENLGTSHSIEEKILPERSSICSKERLKVIGLMTLSAVCLALNPLFQQKFQEENAGLLAIRGLVSGIIPFQMGVLQPMLSADIPQLRAGNDSALGNIRNTLLVHILFGMSINLLQTPLIYYIPNFLRMINLIDLNPHSTTVLRNTLAYDYVTETLGVGISCYLTLLFQYKDLKRSATLITTLELSSLGIAAVLAMNSDLGLKGAAVADFSGSLIALMLIAFWEWRSPPLGRSLFGRDIPSTCSISSKLKEMFKNGLPTYTAEFLLNITQVVSSIRFSNIALQGILGMLENAASVVTGLILDIRSPYISETQGSVRKGQVRKQFLYGLSPILLLSTFAIPLAPMISQTFAKEDSHSESARELRLNVGLYLGCSIISTMFSMLYETLIDCSMTGTAAFFACLSAGMEIGLCFLLDSAMSDSPEVGNLSGLMSLSFALTATSFYTYRNRDKIFGVDAVQQEETEMPLIGAVEN